MNFRAKIWFVIIFLEIWRWYKTWPLFNGYPTAGGLGNPNAMRKPGKDKFQVSYLLKYSLKLRFLVQHDARDSIFIIIKPGLSVSICTHTIFFNGNNSVKSKDVLTIYFLLIFLFFLIFSFFGRKNSKKKSKNHDFFSKIVGIILLGWKIIGYRFFLLQR